MSTMAASEFAYGEGTEATYQEQRKEKSRHFECSDEARLCKTHTATAPVEEAMKFDSNDK